MATTLSEESKRYAAAVAEALSDLPAAEREELIAEVEASLGDIELDTTAGIEERLGAPEQFAFELRAAAGLAPETVPTSDDGLPPAALAPGGRGGLRSVRHLQAVSLGSLGHDAAAIWWLVRGFLIVVGFAVIFNTGFTPGEVPAGSRPVGRLERLSVAISSIASTEGREGVALIVIATIISIGVGIFSRRRRILSSKIRAGVGALIGVLSVVAAIHVWGVSARVYVTQPIGTFQPGLVYNGADVENIYPFTRSGQLLHDVLLYTGSGQPIDIPSPHYSCIGEKYCDTDPNRRLIRTATGKLVLNAFPIRHFEPGMGTVAHPNAIPPTVRIPTIATPPLSLPGAKHHAK